MNSNDKHILHGISYDAWEYFTWSNPLRNNNFTFNRTLLSLYAPDEFSIQYIEVNKSCQFWGMDGVDVFRLENVLSVLWLWSNKNKRQVRLATRRLQHQLVKVLKLQVSCHLFLPPSLCIYMDHRCLIRTSKGYINFCHNCMRFSMRCQHKFVLNVNSTLLHGEIYWPLYTTSNATSIFC